MQINSKVYAVVTCNNVLSHKLALHMYKKYKHIN